MTFSRPSAQIHCPGGIMATGALGRCTHLGIGAHQDDLEILAAHGILECYQWSDRAFVGAIVTDGAGSVRSGPFAHFTDEQMKERRREEQKEAARIGEYSACVFLDHESQQVKTVDGSASADAITEDLIELLKLTRPSVVYTHNLADRHETHVAVTLRVISAILALPEDERPEKVIGCEVWGDLDWLPESHRIEMDVSAHSELQSELLRVFESQIAGGKRYDVATMGRRRAHATFNESHQVDSSEALILGMDLAPLIRDPSLDATGYLRGLVAAFNAEMQERVMRHRI